MVRHEFRIRLNGVVIPEIAIQPAVAEDGQLTGRSQLAVRDPDLGWFSVETEDEALAPGLARFVLEYWDEQAWAEVDSIFRHTSRDKGWRQMTAQELIALVESSSCPGEVDRGGSDAKGFGEDNELLITEDVSRQLWQDLERCFPNEKEIERRAEELLERMEFAAMLRSGAVVFRPVGDSRPSSD